MSRRVLILAHPFPPAGGGGVQRTTKLVKYLGELGWRPTVITTQADLYPKLFNLRDDTLLEDVKHVDIVRVPSPEIRKASARIHRWAPWTSIPDRGRLWNAVALPIAIALHARRRFELIYATGNPYSTYLLAHALASVTNLPYVLDMRDSWLRWEKRTPSPPKIEEELHRLERMTLLAASRVVFVSPYQEEAHVAAYPELRGRTAVIINGYDDGDFLRTPNPSPKKRGDDVEFVNVGVLNWFQRPEPLFAAFRIARERDEDFRRRARFVQVGLFGTSPDERAAFEKSIADNGLTEIVRDLGYRPHPEAVMIQRTADVLMLITSGLKDEQRGKTTEYLAAGRPILALTNEGTAADRVLSLAAKRERAAPDDVEGIARALLSLFCWADENRAPNPLHAPAAELYSISRKHAAEKMAQLFTDAVREGARARTLAERLRAIDPRNL
jgi:glycosyltransferase involved in cell wall biosynthesis